MAPIYLSMRSNQLKLTQWPLQLYSYTSIPPTFQHGVLTPLAESILIWCGPNIGQIGICYLSEWQSKPYHIGRSTNECKPCKSLVWKQHDTSSCALCRPVATPNDRKDNSKINVFVQSYVATIHVKLKLTHSKKWWLEVVTHWLPILTQPHHLATTTQYKDFHIFTSKYLSCHYILRCHSLLFILIKIPTCCTTCQNWSPQA